jgi:hypothetical protein
MLVSNVDRSWRFSAYSGPMQGIAVDRSWRFSAYSGPMQGIAVDRSWRFSAYSGPMQVLAISAGRFVGSRRIPPWQLHRYPFLLGAHGALVTRT